MEQIPDIITSQQHLSPPCTRGSFIKYLHKMFRKINISYPLIRTHKCAYHGVRKVNFAYILNE